MGVSHGTTTSALITSSVLCSVEVFTHSSIFRRLSFLCSAFRGVAYQHGLALTDGMEESGLTRAPWIWSVFFSFPRIHISAELRAWTCY